MYRYCLVFLVFAFFQSTLGVAQDSTLGMKIRQSIKERMEQPGNSILKKSDLHFVLGVQLREFYHQRNFAPVWIGEKEVMAHAREFVGELAKADEEGLDPADYHLPQLKQLIAQGRQSLVGKSQNDIESITDLELILTHSFLLFGKHLYFGKTGLRLKDKAWETNHKKDIVFEILKKQKSLLNVSNLLDALRPASREYIYLKKQLGLYREIEKKGGWPLVSIKFKVGESIRYGDKLKGIGLLKKRLFLTGDYGNFENKPRLNDLFDESLVKATKRFQKRHGIRETGHLDSPTVNALNIPVSERISQIIVNLERLRWLPRDFGNYYILVNIPSFELRLIDNGKVVKKSRVIVGNNMRQTPVFNGRMTFIIFNPYWYIPPSIFIKDMLPSVRRNPEYLNQKRMKVFNAWEKEQTSNLDPHEIDWEAITIEDFPYIIRQDPGRYNALGRVKLMFPNQFSVYLHDTPNKQLFNEGSRGFSSGCIRVENALALAETLLISNKDWNRSRIDRTIKTDDPVKIVLKRPVPVFVLYLTAWANHNNVLHLRQDIYERDLLVLKALKRPS